MLGSFGTSRSTPKKNHFCAGHQRLGVSNDVETMILLVGDGVMHNLTQLFLIVDELGLVGIIGV